MRRTRKRNRTFLLLSSTSALLVVAFVVLSSNAVAAAASAARREMEEEGAAGNEKEKRNPIDENTGTTSTLFGTDGERFGEEMVLVFPPFISVVREEDEASSNRTVAFDEKKKKDDEDVLFQSLFSWKVPKNLEDLETFPRPIARVLESFSSSRSSSPRERKERGRGEGWARLSLKRFSVGFTRGRWRESAFGRKPMNFEAASALGMHVNGVFSADGVDKDVSDDDGASTSGREKEEGWMKLTNAIGAKFCAGANVAQRGLPRFYKAGGRGMTTKKNLAVDESNSSGKTARLETTLFQSYPKEIACVENVASFFEMLPCGGRSGVASIANERSGLIANVKFLSFGASYERGKFSLSMTGVANREVMENMVLEKKDVKSCAAAKEVSRVYALLGDGGVRAVDLKEGEKSSVAELFDSSKASVSLPSTPFAEVGAPRVTITRAILGSGNVRGAISLSVSRFATNARGDTVVRIFHPIPDYVRVFRHTFEVVSKRNASVDSSLSYDNMVSDVSWGKELLEMKITLPRALDSVTIKFRFEKIFLPLELFEADAERGMTFPPAIAFSAPAPGAKTSENNNAGRYERAFAKLGFTESPLFEKLIENEKNDFAHFLDALTVILPVPDGAMPFNATAMACVAFVTHLGALAKILTRRENYDGKAKKLRHLAKVERKRLRAEKKKKKEKKDSESENETSSKVDEDQAKVD
jgi:hypothetical protein